MTPPSALETFSLERHLDVSQTRPDTNDSNPIIISDANSDDTIDIKHLGVDDLDNTLEIPLNTHTIVSITPNKQQQRWSHPMTDFAGSHHDQISDTLPDIKTNDSVVTQQKHINDKPNTINTDTQSYARLALNGLQDLASSAPSVVRSTPQKTMTTKQTPTNQAYRPEIVQNEPTSLNTNQGNTEQAMDYTDTTRNTPQLVCYINDVKTPVRYNLEDPSVVKFPEFEIDPPIYDQICRIYKLEWTNIMSFIYMSKRSAIYNLRLGNGGFDLQSFRTFLTNQVYKAPKYCFKINFSPGFILYAPGIPYKSANGVANPVGLVQLYHPSYVNFGFYDKPKNINNYIDFVEFLDGLEGIDLLNFCKNARQSTVWQLLYISQIEVRITKNMPYILGGQFRVGVGCGLELPRYIKDRKCVVPLTHKPRSSRNGVRVKYTDNLCLFRCLVLARNHLVKSIDKKAKQFFYELYGRDAKIYTYKGIKFDELSKVERIFSVNINVFTLKQKKR